MCPDIPLQTFFLMRNCIEEASGLRTELIVEDRLVKPSGVSNLLEENLVDIVALHSTAYLQIKDRCQASIELCGAAPVFQHPLSDDRPVYFSEIIIHSRNKNKYKNLLDLKGCSWAYNNSKSPSGNLIVLKHLKKELKTNATHFGSIVESGTHSNSIKMVQGAQVEAAAVDSTVLAGYLREHEELADSFVSLASLGPLPIFPLVFNANLSEQLKRKITEGLLSIETNPKFSSQLGKVGLVKFAPVTPDLYLMEQDVSEDVKGMSINTAFY